MAELVGVLPPSRKVAGSILSQGTCLCCRFNPQSGCIREATDQYFSLVSKFLSSLSPFLSKSNEIMSEIYLNNYKKTEIRKMHTEYELPAAYEMRLCYIEMKIETIREPLA